MNNIFEIKNVLNEYEIKNIYNKLLEENWRIDTPYAPISIYHPTFKVSFDKMIFMMFVFITIYLLMEIIF